LEDRLLLSGPTVDTVDTATDSGPTAAGSGSGTTGDLRYVIGQANADPNLAGSAITFDPMVFATPRTITLSPSLGTLDLSESAGPEGRLLGPRYCLPLPRSWSGFTDGPSRNPRSAQALDQSWRGRSGVG
jgi:hypothetical protein